MARDRAIEAVLANIAPRADDIGDNGDFELGHVVGGTAESLIWEFPWVYLIY